MTAPAMAERRLCIIKGHRQLVSETFIQAHIDRLQGDKVVLYNYYPEYTCNGRTIRYFYSRRPGLRKARRVLPQFLYDRLVTQRANEPAVIEDFIGGFFRQQRVDLILAEYGFNGADICDHAKALDIPLVVHFHGHDAHRETDLRPYREKYRKMFEYAYRLISVSRPMTEKLLAMGADEDRILYNPYGAREYFFDVRPNYNDTFVAVGSFVDIKAPYLTLMAFRAVAEAHSQARLVMVGDGPLRETCKSLAKMWEIESRVDFPGALTHAEFLPLLNDACVFVQHSVTTSYGDAEGMPNSILEAGAAGLPVVSTRHAGIPDAVVHGQTGLLVAERDVEAMAAAMGRLLADKALCRDMGERARAHIRRHFDIGRHIRLLEDVLAEARRNH